MIEKRGYGEYRDPISGLTHEEYYGKKYRRKIIMIMSLAVIVIVLLIAYYFLDKAVTEKETLIKELKYMKCSTQCLVIQESSGRSFEQSCVQNCSGKYMGNLTNEEKEVIALKSGKQGNLTAGYDFCLKNMHTSLDYDYQSCFNNFFNAHSDITNFSDYFRYPFGV